MRTKKHYTSDLSVESLSAPVTFDLKIQYIRRIVENLYKCMLHECAHKEGMCMHIGGMVLLIWNLALLRLTAYVQLPQVDDCRVEQQVHYVHTLQPKVYVVNIKSEEVAVSEGEKECQKI